MLLYKYMEKGPQVRQAEAAMNRAAFDVRQVIVDYTDTAFFHATTMVEQAQSERQAMMLDDDANQVRMVHDARATRVARISTFRQDAQDAIASHQLSPDNHDKAHSWLSTKLDNCTTIESAAKKAILSKHETNVRSIVKTEHDKRQAIDGRLEGLGNYLRHNMFGHNWNAFLDLSRTKTASLESFLDTEKVALTTRLKAKHQELRSLIGDKDSQQTQLLASYNTQFDDLLNRLSNSQKQQARQQQTGTNSQSRDHGREQHKPEDPRIRIMMGRDNGAPRRPYKIILVNIDHHRKKDKSDAEIYRLLAKHFHPDKSDHEHAEAIIRILTSSYDSKAKKFVI